MWDVNRARALLSFGCALMLAACGPEEPKDPQIEELPGVELYAFEASAREVMRGESLTLSWTTSHATSLLLFADETQIAAIPEEDLASGSVEVTPLRSLTYRLEARGAGASFAELEQRVEVSIPEAPTIGHFSASHERFGLGTEVTLSWQTSHATSITIEDAAGRPVELAGASPADGSVTLLPEATTTYELVATGPGGRVSETVSITLAPRPVVQLTIEGSPIPVGGEAILRWSASGADEIRILADGEDEPLSTEARGELRVSPERSRAYLVEAIGAGGAVSAEALVEVAPVVDHFVSNAFEAVRPGSQVELFWTSRGAEAVTISNQHGWSYQAPEAEVSAGSVLAPVGAGGAFVITASSGKLRSQPMTISVPLTSEPRILGATVEPAEGVTAGRGQRANIRLSWVVEGADRPLQLALIPGGNVNLVGRSNRMDQVELSVDGPTDLRLTAISEIGTHERIIPAPVFQPPLVTSLEATPARVAAGGSVEIRWTTEDAATVRLERDGLPLDVEPNAVSSSVVDLLAAPGTYRLFAYNELGFEVASEELVVDVGAPVIASFGAEVAYVQPRGTLRFQWESLGGTSLQLVETYEGAGERTVCTSSAPEEIKRGGCEILAPDALGLVGYALRVQNEAGSEVATEEVYITGGPTIDHFAASDEVVVEGSELIFSWSTSEGVEGEVPSLRLRDDLGVEYDLSDADPRGGQKAFTIHNVGQRVFTLVAAAPESGEETYATLRVTVINLPVVMELWAAPDLVEVENEETQLFWKTENARSLTVYGLSKERLPSQAPVCTVTFQPDVDEGSCGVRPTMAFPDVRVVVRHETGAVASRDLAIGVRPARVTSFTVEQPQLIRGETTTLSWTTVYGEEWELGPRYIEHDQPFIDVRSFSNAVNLTERGGQTFQLPEDFRFPYFGELHEYVCVAEGFIEFVTNSSAICYIPFTVPGDFVAGHIAPFLSSEIHPRNGAVWYAPYTHPDGRRSMIVQWSNYGMTAGAYQAANLNFEVILFEDGSVDFRYGTMECTTQQCLETVDSYGKVNGASAMIGYQRPPYLDFEGWIYLHLFTPYAPVYPGLSNRSFSLFPAKLEFSGYVEAEGSREIRPLLSRDFTLVTRNGHSSDERTIHVEVFPAATFVETAVEPEEPLPGEPITVSWTALDLTKLSIHHEDGRVFFETENPEVLAAGQFVIEDGLPQGDHSLTIRAVGELERDVIESVFLRRVYPAYSLDSFTPDRESILPGQEVTLSWTGAGLTGVSIVDSHGAVVPLPPGVDPNGGQVTVQPPLTTTYTLIAESHGREKTASIWMPVRTVTIERFELDADTWYSGNISRTPFSWTTSGEGMISITFNPAATSGQRFQGELLEMKEVTSDPSKRFVDISETEGATEIMNGAAVATYSFPEGFDFPWFGDFRNQARVLSNGVLSFRMNDTNAAPVATEFPQGNASTGERAFAIFWQAVTPSLGGGVWVKHDEEEGTLTFQWKGYQASSSISTDLNFQVVLFKDGAFEYRYGHMSSSNVQYSNGYRANIGWQDPSAKIGYSLKPRNTEVPNPADPDNPGVANRSWRVTPLPASGTLTMNPTEDTEIELCVTDATWRECQTKRLYVVGAGGLMITEVMVVPAGDPTAQWIEVRNFTGGTVDMRGMKLGFFPPSGAVVEHTIDAPEPVIIEGYGGFKVFSAKPIPGVDSYVYGEELQMRNTGARRQIQITDGAATRPVVLAGLTWTWDFEEGVSWEVNSHRQHFMTSATPNNNLASWCQPTRSYDGGLNFGTPGEMGPTCTADAFYDLNSVAELPFIDLKASRAPTIEGAEGDTAFFEIPGGLPFAFPYFGGVLQQGHPVWGSANGFIQFGELVSDYPTAKTSFPTAAAPNLGVIAPFWQNLRGASQATFRYGEEIVGSQRVFILQWDGYEIVAVPGGRMNFQAQLWENGDIVFAYKDLWGGPYYWGTATVGFESANGEAGFLFSRNRRGLTPGQAIHFQRR